MTALALLQSGGWVMFSILLLSLVAWTLILWKYVQLIGFPLRRPVWLDDVLRHSEAGNREAASQLCAAYDSPLARVVREVLRNKTNPEAQWGTALQAACRAESSHLHRHLPLIAVMAAMAPLLGLLGTVTGMIQTFASIFQHDAGRISVFSDGISQALITTQGGLVVALPILLMHHWLSSRARRATDAMVLYGRHVELSLQNEPVKTD